MILTIGDGIHVPGALGGRNMRNSPDVYKFVACAMLLFCSTTSALAESDAWLVSVHCDKFQHVAGFIRVNGDTDVVDTNWDGYSLRAGQTIADAPNKKLFRMIVEACKF